jgi:hypothetical protein
LVALSRPSEVASLSAFLEVPCPFYRYAGHTLEERAQGQMSRQVTDQQISDKSTRCAKIIGQLSRKAEDVYVMIDNLKPAFGRLPDISDALVDMHCSMVHVQWFRNRIYLRQEQA